MTGVQTCALPICFPVTIPPLNNFKPFFTLFSKFFPSFLHSTCSLSVSRQYLALDGVYHPIWPAFPSKPTLWSTLTTHSRPSQRRGSNPLWHPVPRTDFYPGLHKFAPIDYNSEDFRLELFPVHSPLLGESWLVSFPPLSDMLTHFVSPSDFYSIPDGTLFGNSFWSDDVF